MPTMVMPAGAGGRGATTWSEADPRPEAGRHGGGGGWATFTEKTRSHCGQRTRRPAAGIFCGSTS